MSRRKMIQVFVSSSDTDVLLDQFEMLFLEKIEGNENLQLNEQNIANTDKLFENESETTNQHQNVVSKFN